jgi:hypothetical protein
MAEKQTHTFQTEVSQLLDLMIHSLYSNKEIFLRELVSNASDAIDKLKFETLSDDSLVEGKENLAVYIDVNKDKKTITITDNGIGTFVFCAWFFKLFIVSKNHTKQLRFGFTNTQSQPKLTKNARLRTSCNVSNTKVTIS